MIPRCWADTCLLWTINFQIGTVCKEQVVTLNYNIYYNMYGIYWY